MMDNKNLQSSAEFLEDMLKNVGEPGYIGKKILELRKREGLTQEQFGKELSLSISAISAYENGIRCPELKSLKSIAIKFGVDFPTLIGMDLNVKIPSYNRIPTEDDYIQAGKQIYQFFSDRQYLPSDSE